MLKKTMLAALAATAALCLSIPAFAETFTSPDGVLSIDLPNENWKAMQDPSTWITLSDGANMLTVDHLSNGEKLPDMAIADDHYVNVYQATFSTQNEVFIITGSIVDAAVIPDVVNAIASAKVLKYDTKMAVSKTADTAQAGGAAAVSGSTGLTVVSASGTMYATTGVNVRSGYSTNDAVLGGLAAGSPVTITGKVQQNGKDYGWYQVSYGSGKGYVSAQFLTSTAPAAGKTDTGLTFNGKAKTIYKSDGTAITVYQASDSNWYDSNGKKYVATTDYEFVSSDGSTTYTVNKPQTSSLYAIGSPFTAYWENGNGETLTQYSDGYYYSSGWVRYYDNGDNTYRGADGTVLYASLGGPSSPAATQTDDENETHLLISRDNGSSVTVSAGGGAYYDASGTEYSWIDDGGMMDYYGNTYDVSW